MSDNKSVEVVYKINNILCCIYSAVGIPLIIAVYYKAKIGREQIF